MEKDGCTYSRIVIVKLILEIKLTMNLWCHDQEVTVITHDHLDSYLCFFLGVY